MKKLILLIILLAFIPSASAQMGGMVIGSGVPAAGGESPTPENQFDGSPYTTGMVYSVGTTATELDNEGTITVAANIATFSVAFPTNVGVGDVVQYDADNSTTIDAADEYGIIYGINSDRTKAYLLRKDGSTGVTNTTSTTSVYDIFRSYTSLVNWEADTANTNIDDDIETVYDRGGDINITGEGWLYVACYGDGIDTSRPVISGWTTTASDFIKIYTPVGIAEVGTTQRHLGIHDGSGHYILSFADNGEALTIVDDYIRIEGLDIRLLYSSSNSDIGVLISGGTEIWVSDCLIDVSNPGSAIAYGIQIGEIGAGDDVYIFNNAIRFESASNNNRGIDIAGGPTTVDIQIYSNTLTCDAANAQSWGISASTSASATIDIKNTVIYFDTETGLCFRGNYTGTTTNNASTDATAPNTNEVDLSAGGVCGGSMCTFAEVFNDNADTGDTRLESGSELIELGADLDGDTPPITDDIIGQARDASTPDIGSYEYTP